jgi:regulator of sigma E protease
MIVTVCAFLIVLGVLVFFHELGHFWMARRCGVHVNVFSIGFGKELFGWTDTKGTRWRISLVPLGGYVKMLGDADISSSKADPSIIQSLSEQDKQKTLDSKHPKDKIKVALAGPLANLILAAVIFYIILVFKGLPILSSTIGHVDPNSIAYAQGLRDNDQIQSINEIDIKDFRDLQRVLPSLKGQTFDMVIKRNGEVLTLPIEFFKNVNGQKVNIDVLGVSSKDLDFKKVNPLRSLGLSLELVANHTKKMLSDLPKIFMNKENRKQIGSMFTIADVAGQTFSQGLWVFLQFMAIFSINLGVFNLLPVPMLDGGQIMINGIEWVIRRPLPEKIKIALLYTGVAVVVGVMMLGMFNDAMKYLFKK